MTFNSTEFLLIFLPLTLFFFYIVPPRGRLIVLMISSVAFYSADGFVPLIFLLASTAWGFAMGWLAMWHRRAKVPATVLAVVAPMLVLFLFKYLGWMLNVVHASPEAREPFLMFLSITLPPGLSFYTFHLASYAIDLRRGKVPLERDWLIFASYIFAFPHLVAGPILRYGYFAPQLRALREGAIKADFPNGFKLLAFGLAGKIMMADVTQMLWRNHLLGSWETQARPIDAAFVVLSYSFTIYWDFWAYSIMAIGLGKLIGLELPRNFAEPYLSLSPGEFWRRWHISLSLWLRDYVYIPLGGKYNYVPAIVIVFTACGMWHGAGTSFLIWGVYHAVLVLMHHFLKEPWSKMPRVLQIAITFTLVSLGWPLFYTDLDGWLRLLHLLGGASTAGAEGVYGLRHWGYLAFVALVTFGVREDKHIYNPSPLRLLNAAPVHAGLIAAAVSLVSLTSTFIYFRF